MSEGRLTASDTSAQKLSVEILMQEAAEQEPIHPVASEGLAENYSSTMSEGPMARAIVLGLVLLIAGTYTWYHIGRGWVPADEGTLSQSALRTMQGQLPHRDFGEIYTGGLSFIHAMAFRFFGVNLMSLRFCVFLFFLAWLPAVYYIALRFTSAFSAGAITLLAVAWSYPNYPAAMPSWYNLFFATFGAAALMRYLDVRQRRWLFVAGVCGGISILIKVIGAYYIAGVLLFLTYLEQSESVGTDDEKPSHRGPMRGTAYRVFSVGALLLFLTTLILVLRQRLGGPELFQFVLPSTAVVGLIILGETGVCAKTGQRFRTMFQVLLPFFGGVATPILIFLIPYLRSGAVLTLLRGVTASAVSRSAGLGVIRPVGIQDAMWVWPLIGVLAAAMFWRQFQSKLVGITLVFAAATIAVRSKYSFDVVSAIWLSVTVLTPVSVLLGAVLIWWHRNQRGVPKIRWQRVVLLLALAATCSLVQFPFAAPIYLSYALPLTLLAVVAIVSTAKTQPGTYALASVVALYLAFGVISLVPRYIYELTYAVGHMDAMRGPRAGGLQIEGAAYMDELSRFLREHSPNGTMLAVNDCPELYFLSGLKSIAHDDGGEPAEEILQTIQSNDLKLVVINDAPFFPGAVLQTQVRTEVARKFPNTARFGIFEVFWRE